MDDLDRQVTLTITLEEVMALIGSVQRSLRYWKQHTEHPNATHSVEEYTDVQRRYGELLWRLETSATPQGGGIQHSEGAVRPLVGGDDDRSHTTADEGTAVHPAPRRDSADDHHFIVERLLPGGRWVTQWSAATSATVQFRGACSCGWSGATIGGDLATGREDDESREQVYNSWNRTHVPGYEHRTGIN